MQTSGISVKFSNVYQAVLAKETANGRMGRAARQIAGAAAKKALKSTLTTSMAKDDSKISQHKKMAMGLIPATGPKAANVRKTPKK